MKICGFSFFTTGRQGGNLINILKQCTENITNYISTVFIYILLDNRILQGAKNIKLNCTFTGYNT